MFGDLGGSPVATSAAKEGTAATPTRSPAARTTRSGEFSDRAYTGITLIKVLSEPYRMDEKLGLDFLGFPATNGRSRLYGGWPQVQRDRAFHDRIRGERKLPYVDDNWQHQYSAEPPPGEGRSYLPAPAATSSPGVEPFETGTGPVRFSSRRANHHPRGAFAKRVQHVANFLLGLRRRFRPADSFEDNQTRSRNWQFSTFVKDQWQIGRA